MEEDDDVAVSSEDGFRWPAAGVSASSAAGGPVATVPGLTRPWGPRAPFALARAVLLRAGAPAPWAGRPAGLGPNPQVSPTRSSLARGFSGRGAIPLVGFRPDAAFAAGIVAVVAAILL